MHEYPVVREIISQAMASLPPGVRLKSLRVAIGEASGISRACVEHYFPTAAAGTPAEGASLEFAEEKLAARCRPCQLEFKSEPGQLRCPACGSTQLQIVSGQEVKLLGFETCAPPSP